MKDCIRNTIYFLYIFMILGVIACAGKPPKPSSTCPNDIDCDGFSDQIEAQGFSTFYFDSGPGRFYSPCTGNEPIGSGERAACVNSSSPDLFAILVRADNTLIPASSTFNPFEYVSKAASSTIGGLGIAVHEVPESWVSSTRQVTITSNSLQKAIIIRENKTLTDFSAPDCDGTFSIPLGITTDVLSDDPVRGTPIDGYESKVRTGQIVGYIDYYCNDATSCKEKNFSSNGISGATGECDWDEGVVTSDELDDLDLRLIKHVIAHEVAHNLKLIYRSTNYGWHHRPGTRNYFLMESIIDVDPSSGDVEFHIADYFCDDCRLARRVWE